MSRRQNGLAKLADGRPSNQRMRGAWRALALIILLAAVALTYQNCSEPRGGGILGSSEAGTPFAFDVSVDHMAYMSCSGLRGGTYDPSSFFTFRVGAYGSSSGLRINQEFLDYTRYLDKNRRAELLAQSPMNKGAQLHLAVRSAASIHDVLMGSGGSPRVGFDYQYILGSLSTPEFLLPMFAGDLGAWHRYIPGLEGYRDKRVEGSLSFLDSEALAEFVRQQMMNNGALLSMTYKSATHPEDASLARTPAEFKDGAAQNEFAYIYGKGLRINVKQGGSANPKKASRVLASVESVDLLDRVTDSTENWTCPGALALRIVRNADAATACAKVPDPASPSANLKIIRRLLPVEDWWVNEAAGCVVPKKFGECYDPEIAQVEYSPTAVCGDGTQPACAHYVSVCIR